MPGALHKLGGVIVAPEWLVRDLRTVDPRADLLYIGGNDEKQQAEWWLLFCPERWQLADGGNERFRKGCNLKALLLNETGEIRPSAWRLADIQMGRMGWLGAYFGEPGSHIFHTFQEANWRWRQERAAHDQAQLDQIDEVGVTERKRERVRKFAGERAKEAHPYFLRGRRSFDQGARRRSA